MKTGWIAIAGLISGCAMLPASLRQMAPASGQNLSAAIPPGAGIKGRAGLLQDSLRPRLEWLAPQLAKEGPLLERLAFRQTKDSLVQLMAEFTDANGWNTHGRTPGEIACLERGRWVRVEKSWPAKRTEAGLEEWPLRVKIAFRGHDVQRGRSEWAWDTLGLEVTDSVRWNHGGFPLSCP